MKDKYKGNDFDFKIIDGEFETAEAQMRLCWAFSSRIPRINYLASLSHNRDVICSIKIVMQCVHTTRQCSRIMLSLKCGWPHDHQFTLRETWTLFANRAEDEQLLASSHYRLKCEPEGLNRQITHLTSLFGTWTFIGLFAVNQNKMQDRNM